MPAQEYESVPFIEDSDDASEKWEHWLSLSHVPTEKRRRLTSFLTSCLLLSAGVLIGAGLAAFLGRHLGGNGSDVQRTFAPSPILHEMDIQYHSQQFNGSLMKQNIYRLDGSPEVDAAWESLGVNYRSAIIPEELAVAAGLAPDQVRIRPKYGGGFPANVEGLHQLHCLNLVRQALYYNIDYYRKEGKGAFQNKEHIVKKHVSHCLDIIRQQLMCTVDIGVLGQVWFQPAGSEWPEAFVDFNTNHICRNFDAVREWARVRQLPDDVPEDYLEPPKSGDRIYTEVP